MVRKGIEIVFFGNYFVGFLAVALSLEAAFQLRIPFNAPWWYGLLFCGVVLYYTYAYAGVLNVGASINPRSEWYAAHRGFVRVSQLLLLIAAAGITGWLFSSWWRNSSDLSWGAAAILVVLPAVALLYYGLLPSGLIQLNLRNTGWAKAFVIGFVWAGSVTLLPLVFLELEGKAYTISGFLVGWFFLKNWMFCAVNAVMFDMKDYDDDSNRQLKTFVVRYGSRFTLLYILVPLIGLGIAAFGLFAYYIGLHWGAVVLNLIPFLLTLAVAWSMQQERPILYYLIVIDGMLLVKAGCGILSVVW